MREHRGGNARCKPFHFATRPLEDQKFSRGWRFKRTCQRKVYRRSAAIPRYRRHGSIVALEVYGTVPFVLTDAWRQDHVASLLYGTDRNDYILKYYLWRIDSFMHLQSYIPATSGLLHACLCECQNKQPDMRLVFWGPYTSHRYYRWLSPGAAPG